MDELFKVLGLQSDASFEDVREAYKDLVSVWHPDRFADNPRVRAKAEEKLKEINDAYERLLPFLNNRNRNERHGSSTKLTKATATHFGHSTTEANKNFSKRRFDRKKWLAFLAVASIVVGAGVYLSKTRRGSTVESNSTKRAETGNTQPQQTSATSNATAASSSPDLEAYLEPVATPTPESTPSPKAELDDLFDPLPPSPSPTIPNFDEWRTRQNEKTTSTPLPTPRVERLVDASDMLRLGYRKSEDSRRYRFTIQNEARIKGTFSAQGGGVTVRVFSGSDQYYVSGINVSADSLDVVLYPGVYEATVTLVGTEITYVSFSIRIEAYYN